MNELKAVMRNAPECPKEQPEPVKCSMFERCKGCKYPAHGFVCWNRDGSCLRTLTSNEEADSGNG